MQSKPKGAKNEPAATAGENQFVDYMRNLGHVVDRWQEPTKKQPDFIVEVRGKQILCELKDLEDGNFEQDVISGAVTAGAWNPLKKTRTRTWSSIEQLNEGQGKYPTICVISEQGITPYTFPLFMQNMLYTPPILSPKAGLFHEPQAKTISAVAVLEAIDLVPRERRQIDITRGISREFLQQDVRELLDLVGGQQKIKPVRMRLYHNPFANLPLADGIFGGQYDCDARWNQAIDRISYTGYWPDSSH